MTAVIADGVANGCRFVRGTASQGWFSLAGFLAGAYPPAAAASLQAGDLASILYTSGTTGLPKGVMNCHNAYVTAGLEFAQRYARLRHDDVLYTSPPLFHVNAQMLTTVGSICPDARWCWRRASAPRASSTTCVVIRRRSSIHRGDAHDDRQAAGDR